MTIDKSQTSRQEFEHILRLIRSGQLDMAAPTLAKLRQKAPQDLNLMNLAAMLAGLQDNHAAAQSLYEEILSKQPDRADIRYNMLRATAIAAERRQDHNAALTALRAARVLQPEDRHLAAQTYLQARQLADLNEPVPSLPPVLQPAAAMILLDDPATQRRNAEAWARAQFGAITPLPPSPVGDRTGGPLKVGFLSSDWHEHATAYLLADFFACLDSARIAAYVYSYGIKADTAHRHRIMAASHFIEVGGLDAKAVAARLRADAIDIAIDLKGYSRGGRLDILAYRPAPLQMHWLGFPGTLGCSFIDYFIADAITLPTDLQAHFSEKILTLPHCYQPNDRQKPLPPKPSRQAYGLPENALVFASFNQPYKLTPAWLQLWVELVHSVPNSVLWLLAPDKSAEENIRSFLLRAGMSPEQIIFAPPVGQYEHLQRTQLADIALDTFPIGGHTTTSDALWLGVPVITLPGAGFVSNVAASLLHNVGLPELVASSPAAYTAIAKELALNPERRNAMRAQLIQNRLQHPLFDTQSFADDFTTALGVEWDRRG
jgi:protein O-GlcNAc transferase